MNTNINLFDIYFFKWPLESSFSVHTLFIYSSQHPCKISLWTVIFIYTSDLVAIYLFFFSHWRQGWGTKKIRWETNKGSHDNFDVHRKIHFLLCSWGCLRDILFCKHDLELRQYDLREEKTHTTLQTYFKIFILFIYFHSV